MTTTLEPVMITELEEDAPERDLNHYFCRECFPDGTSPVQTLCGMWDPNPLFEEEDWTNDEPCSMCLAVEACPNCWDTFGEWGDNADDS